MIQKVKKAQAGDEQAFLELFAQYEAELYRMAYVQVRSEQDALDVMQETAYRAFRGISGLKQPQYFKTWLVRILLNCATDHLRKTGSVLQLIPEYVENTTDFSQDDEQQILRRAALEHLMTVLTPTERSLILLRYYQEYTFREIARIMGMPLGTVKSGSKEDGLYE